MRVGSDNHVISDLDFNFTTFFEVEYLKTVRLGDEVTVAQ